MLVVVDQLFIFIIYYPFVHKIKKNDSAKKNEKRLKKLNEMEPDSNAQVQSVICTL